MGSDFGGQFLANLNVATFSTLLACGAGPTTDPLSTLAMPVRQDRKVFSRRESPRPGPAGPKAERLSLWARNAWGAPEGPKTNRSCGDLGVWGSRRDHHKPLGEESRCANSAGLPPR